MGKVGEAAAAGIRKALNGVFAASNKGWIELHKTGFGKGYAQKQRIPFLRHHSLNSRLRLGGIQFMRLDKALFNAYSKYFYPAQRVISIFGIWHKKEAVNMTDGWEPMG